MSLFTGSIYVMVRDQAAAVSWYKETFGLRESPEPIDEEIGDIQLQSANEDLVVIMGAQPGPDETPMLRARNLVKAREWLIARTVKVSEIQTDRQGTQYFEMRDPADNMIEINNI